MQYVKIPKHILKHLVNALRFYGDDVNYKRVVDAAMSDIDKDRGNLARLTLKNVKDNTIEPEETNESIFEEEVVCKPRTKSWSRSTPKRSDGMELLPPTPSKPIQK